MATRSAAKYRPARNRVATNSYLISLLIHSFVKGDVNVSPVLGRDCSRSQSRIVRKFLEKELWTRLKSVEHSSLLPNNCPVNTQRDIYREQETGKHKKPNGECTCNYCEKVFKNEYYFDKHMDLKHDDIIPATADICLADLCPIFGCSYVSKSTALGSNANSNQRRRHSQNSNPSKAFVNIEPCTNKDIADRKAQCESILER